MFKLSNYFPYLAEAGEDEAGGGGGSDDAVNNSLFGDGAQGGSEGKGGEGGEGEGGEDKGGEGGKDTDRPEWLPEKYATAEEMAASMADMESKLGGFTGAPEGDYALNVPEGAGDFEFFEHEEHSIKQFQEIARAEGVSQEAFDKFLGFYVDSRIYEDSKDLELRHAESMKYIGGVERAQTISAKAKASVSEEDYKLIQLAASTNHSAQGAVMKLVEKYVLNGETNPLGGGNPPSGGKSKSELKEMVADPRYKTDPDFRKEVEDGFEKLFPN